MEVFLLNNDIYIKGKIDNKLGEVFKMVLNKLGITQQEFIEQQIKSFIINNINLVVGENKQSEKTMKTERITIRVTEEEKEIEIIAEKLRMNTSEYVHKAIIDKMELDKLNDSQGQFLDLFDVAFKRSYEPINKHNLVVLNRTELNTRIIIKALDIFMQHLKVPQNKDDLNISIIPHPIIEVAEEKVLKDLRSMRTRKSENIDE